MIRGADADTNIREQENSNIQYIAQYYMYIIATECGYQILMTKICNGGRVSYILTNLVLDINAVNGKHLTYKLSNNRPPSVVQTI